MLLVLMRLTRNSRQLGMRLAIGAACALATTACASATGGGAAGSATTSSYDVVAASQLQSSAASNLYDAISQLRPELLTGHRRGVPDVFIGTVKQQSGMDRLKQLSVGSVAEVRYVPFEQARTLAGAQSEAGALVVTLR